MAIKKIIVQPHQSIWDIAIIHYGSIEGVKQLIIDNPLYCDFQNNLTAGTVLIIQQDPVNKQVVDFFNTRIIKPATAYIPTGVWILAGGYWNDDGFWDDNALWID